MPVGHLVEPTSFEFDGASAPATMHAHDLGIGARGQSRKEVAAVSVNAIKQLVAEEAEVEHARAVRLYELEAVPRRRVRVAPSAHAAAASSCTQAAWN